MAQTLPLLRTMDKDGPQAYYRESFRQVLEEHIPWFIANGFVHVMTAEPYQAVAAEFDFYSLLTDLKVPIQQNWIILRLNGMTAPHEYRAERTAIYIPDFNVIERMRANHQTIHRIA